MNPESGQGQTYRFVVASAEEAVKMIHEKLGSEARVISVRQVGGTGFTGLFRSPQLEVIAEVTAPPAPEPPQAPPAVPSAEAATFEIALPDAGVEAEIEETLAYPEPLAPIRGAKPMETCEALERILLRSGFSELMLMRLRRSSRWDKLSARPLREALVEVAALLRAEWGERAERPLGRRVAFFGTPGSGTTTALCKELTIDKFIRGQEAVVLKLDGDQPNPAEGLAMYCEALNVPFLRSSDELDFSPARVYLDLTGGPLQDQRAWRALGYLLSEFYVDTRVLVVNAAYDSNLIRSAFDRSRDAGATHVVFSHLDEIQHWGKLWEPLMEGGLTPLFFSRGQNISGDIGEDMLELLVEKTFGVRK
jgi:flagellar biosynthesis protein FlhF